MGSRWSENKVRFSHGFPQMPPSLQVLSLALVEAVGDGVDIAASLAHVRALTWFELRNMVLPRALDAAPCFSSLSRIVLDRVENANPTSAFWTCCKALKTLQVSGLPEARGRAPETPIQAPFFVDEVIQLPATLEVLTLKNILVPALPPSIVNCTQMKTLEVSGCQLSMLPQDISRLQNLEVLSLNSNCLTLEGLWPLVRCSALLTCRASGLDRSVSLEHNPGLPDGIPRNASIISYLASLPQQVAGVREFSSEQLQRATQDFAASRLIDGNGSFGPVYRGSIGSLQIAVKVMGDPSPLSRGQLHAELCALQQCRHPCLLQLLGCSLDGPRPCIVYEYKANGSLRKYLDTNGGSVGWRRRLCVMAQIASALEFLHTIVVPPIIHRDIKSANILLDSLLNASLGDFGLARIAGSDVTVATGVSTRIMGTPGYIDPEYALSGKVTLASDVFSFGIVCLELVTSRLAYDSAQDPPALLNAYDEAVEDRTIDVLVDVGRCGWPLPNGQTVLALVGSCVKSRGTRRPSAAVVAAKFAEFSQQWACSPEQLAGEESAVKCVVCLSENATHAFVPCGHKCVCGDHAAQLVSARGTCPLCRVPIERDLRLY